MAASFPIVEWIATLLVGARPGRAGSREVPVPTIRTHPIDPTDADRACRLVSTSEADRPRSSRRLFAVASLLLVGCAADQVRYRTVAPPPTSAPSDATVFLVGDAGEISAGRDAVMSHLEAEIATATSTSDEVLVAFLGDNIYEVGAREEHRDEDFPRLAAQIEPLGDYGNLRTVFVPGNHDWGHGGSDEAGRLALSTQADWLRELAGSRDVRLMPEGACPGPTGVDIGSSVHAVFIDTEWLLRAPEDGCGSPEAFYQRLTDHLRARLDRHILVLGHHPLSSGGEHGGNLAPLDDIPVLTYLVRKAGVARQDIMSGAYREMIERLEGVFDTSGGPPLVFAAGHEHNLQVISVGRGSAFRLVSGSAAKSTPTRRIEGTRYATDGYGYMRLVARGSEVTLVVYATAGTMTVEPVFSCALTGPEPCPEAPLREGSR